MSSSLSTVSEDLKELYKTALFARERAYAPYSGHRVGAAILLSNGKIYSGCNIENSSFGATNCAERVAIQKAVSELGQIEIVEIMVVTQADPPWPPCGLCRQVISEFGKEIKIHAANLEGKVNSTTFAEIFPNAFNSDYLAP